MQELLIIWDAPSAKWLGGLLVLQETGPVEALNLMWLAYCQQKSV